jgi:hypothetical protein
MSEIENEEREPKGITRRTVTKSMAWAVPVIAVAATVPSAAASCVPVLSLGAGSCKCPGQSTGDPFTYYLRVCGGGVTCPDFAGEIVVTKIVSNSGVQVYTGPSVGFTAGDCILLTGTSSNSANFLEIYFTINGEDAGFTRVDSPPDCDKTANPAGTCATT